MVTDIIGTATDISTFINVFTATLIPAIGTAVLAIVTFIRQHQHSPRIVNALDRIAKLEGQAMAVDKTAGAQATTIGTVASLDPAVQVYIATHEAQMKAYEQKIADLSAKIASFEAFIPKDAHKTT